MKFVLEDNHVKSWDCGGDYNSIICEFLKRGDKEYFHIFRCYDYSDVSSMYYEIETADKVKEANEFLEKNYGYKNYFAA